MSINIVSVADSISKLSVTGVTIKDLDELPNGVLSRDCPLILPAPGFIQAPGIERQSYGSGATAQWDFRYTLNYRFFYKEIGGERKLGNIYPTMVTKAFAFVDAVILNDALSGAVDANFAGMTNFGPVPDPSDKLFWGCEIQIEIMEFVN